MPEKAECNPIYNSSLKPSTSIFHTTALYGLALLQVLMWLGLGSYLFTLNAKVQDKVIPIVTAVTWLYASLQPIIWSFQTVFFDLFALYLAHLVTAHLFSWVVLQPQRLPAPATIPPCIGGMCCQPVRDRNFTHHRVEHALHCPERNNKRG